MPPTYTIRQFAIKRYIIQSLVFIAVWLVLGLGILSLINNPSEITEWVSISVYVIGFVAMLFLSRYLATRVCTYKLTDTGITQLWQNTGMPLSPANQSYRWQDIASYKVDEDANGTLIKLSLKNGNSLTIAHSDSITDDFEALKMALIAYIDNYNLTTVNIATTEGDVVSPIVKAPSHFETKVAKVLAVVIGILLVILTLVQWLLDIGMDSFQWWKTIWIYAIGIPYIIRVFGKNPAKYK
jgi:hypothetical protein